MDIVKRNAHDTKAANTYMKEESAASGSSSRPSNRSSRTSMTEDDQSSQQRQRPDSAFAVLQGNILAQRRKKVSMITLRREREQLESDISAIRGLL